MPSWGLVASLVAVCILVFDALLGVTDWVGRLGGAQQGRKLLETHEVNQGTEGLRGDAVRPTKPNIIWFLTDDQDQILGGSFPPTAANGATPMPKAKKLLQDLGTHAENWHIHTPICSPSRAELLTGRYFHNVKQVGQAYMHVNYSKVNENNFVRLLKENAGYTTGMFGKYLNVMPESLPGFDVWLANDGGSYIAPSFQVKNIAGLPDGHVQFTSDASNYSTAIIGNASLAWIKEVAGKGQPFFAYIAPKAAHEPFNPAPWYRDHWDPSWPSQEPRPQNWNCSAESRQNHHGNIASQPMITEEAAEIVTGVFKNRWRTLMSVDDLIADVFSALETQGVLDNTYLFFSSDHGFQLGQFNILMDKRHTYEWDTKIHLVARGPGIEAGSSFAAPSTQVDIAPTILGLAGLEAPETMDGKSVVPFLLSSSSEVLASLLPSTRQHLQGLGDLTDYAAKWRQEVFIEYYYNDYNSKCVTHKECGSQHNDYPNSDSNCVDLASNSKCWCNHNTAQEPDCYPTETLANNFAALRTFTVEGANHLLYAEFQPGDQAESNIDFKKADFTELFDVQNDPWEMNNLAKDPAFVPVRTKLHKTLHAWLACSGSSCP